MTHTGPSYRVSIVRDAEELRRLRSDWDHLLRQSAANTIFLTWEWVTSWWASYGADKELWILKIECDGHLAGLAPFYRHSFTRFGVCCYRGVYLLGDGSADSDYLDVIARMGEEEAVARSIATFLLVHPAEWDLLSLSEIPQNSTTLRHLRRFLRDARCLWREAEVPCAEVRLPGDWEEYLKSLKPRIRTKIRSLTRRLEEGHAVKFLRCTSPAELPGLLQSLFALHDRRWNSKGGSGVFLSPEKRHFYGHMSDCFLERGWLRFYSLLVNNAIVAHEFCFEYDDRVFLLQEGFDPAWSEWGIGNVLRAYVFRECIERKVKYYDFLGGVTPHKLSWGAHTKNSLRVQAGRPIPKNHLLLQAPEIFAATKLVLKRVLPEWIISLRRTARYSLRRRFEGRGVRI